MVLPLRSVGLVIPVSAVVMMETSVCWWIAATARQSVNLPVPARITAPVKSSAANCACPDLSIVRFGTLPAPFWMVMSMPASAK